MVKMNINLTLTNKEIEAVYKILKEYEENLPKTEEEIHVDYYDNYEELVDKKTFASILKKIYLNLSKESRKEIDKDFLRKKYSTFNSRVDEKVYTTIEKAFSQLKTAEIKYFNMESAEFSRRLVNIYYKSRRYVIGYCYLRKSIRKFRTSRIASAKLTQEKYKIPEGFDKNNY